MFFVWTLVLHSPFINYDWLRNELFMRSTNQMQNLNLFNLPCFSALKQFAFFRHEFSVTHHDYFSLWFVALIKCSFTIIIQKALQNDCSLVFYRAFARLRVFTLSSLVMFTCHLIGWCKYFEFGFAALIENALCRVFSLYSWVVGYSHKKSSYTTFIWPGWTEKKNNKNDHDSSTSNDDIYKKSLLICFSCRGRVGWLMKLKYV